MYKISNFNFKKIPSKKLKKQNYFFFENSTFKQVRIAYLVNILKKQYIKNNYIYSTKKKLLKKGRNFKFKQKQILKVFFIYSFLESLFFRVLLNSGFFTKYNIILNFLKNGFIKINGVSVKKPYFNLKTNDFISFNFLLFNYVKRKYSFEKYLLFKYRLFFLAFIRKTISYNLYHIQFYYWYRNLQLYKKGSRKSIFKINNNIIVNYNYCFIFFMFNNLNWKSKPTFELNTLDMLSTKF